MIYPEAIQYLYSLRWFGAKLGLTNTVKLAALAGHPQRKLRFIHVAGTNGKGSTCAMLESIYRAAGLRVGLFTSPHLVSFRERIQVNRELISEDDVAGLVEELTALIQEEWGTAGGAAFEAAVAEHPTFFEVITIMALRYFAARRCDLVIWETGLGGRLDATNIVQPLASVITNIQYDHEKWLGKTLASIAAEKAGIIKPGVPVITAAAAPEAFRVIEDTARRQDAPLTFVSLRQPEPRSCANHAPEPPQPAPGPSEPQEFCQRILDGIELPLLGEHQRLNAAVAITTVRALTDQIPISEDALRSGLSKVQWAGRLQLVERPSGQRILLDGAHNPGGAEILAAWLKQSFGLNFTLVLGILNDKDWRRMCGILAPLAARILVVPVPSERSAAQDELAQACRGANPRAQTAAYGSLSEALAQTENDPLVVIAGSLYLVGEAIELLGLSPANFQGERELNEWSQARR
jgi:dihydrofolate synthase/folylpolyglutamate synthase